MKKVFFGFIVIATLPLIALQPEPGALFVRIADVGAGLCCIIRLPTGEHMIYDAGNRSYANKKIKELIPEDGRIELLVLSHSDADHLGSVPFICENYDVKTIVHCGLMKPKKNSTEPTDTWRRAMIAIQQEAEFGDAKELNLGTTNLSPGKIYELGGVSVYFVYGLHKPKDEWDFSPNEGEYWNAGSIVIRMDYQGRSVLFCGDTVGRKIGGELDMCVAAERDMVEAASTHTIDSDVMIGPHHGADNGSSTRFIRAVSPRYVIFSAGSDHEHPRAAAVKRYLQLPLPKSRIYRTDRGDDEGGKEWSYKRVEGARDKPGDDDVDILIRPTGGPLVRYRH